MRKRRMLGKIKKLTENGFGFITPDLQEGEVRAKDVFFHARSLVSERYDDLVEGDRVEFDVIESSEKGPAASGVRTVA